MGEAGTGKLSTSLWNPLTPLRFATCPRASSSHSLTKKCALDNMLHSLHAVTDRIKHTKARANARAFLKWKNKEKSRLILDATPIIVLDARKPKNFLLPFWRGSCNGLGRKGREQRSLYVAKLNLQNALWSILCSHRNGARSS